MQQSVKGFYYFPNIGEFSNIVEKLDEYEWSPITSSEKSRVVQHYGYRYNYNSKNIDEKTQDIPDFLLFLQNILKEKCLSLGIVEDDYEFNQCIVNNYERGQGISKHIDHKKFGKVIGCFTLNGGTTVIFKNGLEKKEIYVEPNSLYIMSGDSRYKWTHEISNNKNDIIKGKRVPRERRISVTFRNV